MPLSAFRPVALFSIPLLALVALAAPLRSPAGAQGLARLTGTVTDPDGARVAGAQVSLEAPAGLLTSTTTTASGEFDVASLRPGAYVVLVSHPGLLADPVRVVLAAGETRTLAIPTVLSALTDAIVVSAGHVEAPASSLPSAVTVFGERDIEHRQVEGVADLLRLTPGMSVARYGGRGGLTSVFPRGGESDYTLVLLDGVRANSMGGSFDFSLLPASGVERVEVVRGPQSALHGADAIGGVVQVITRGGGATRASGAVEGGTFDTVRAYAGAAGSGGDWSWGGGAEKAVTDGYEGLTPDGDERVTNDDARHWTVYGNVRWARTGWDAAGHARRLETERGFPGPFGSDPNGTFGGVDRISRGWNEHTTLGGQLTRTFSSTVRARGSVTLADLDGRFQSPFGDSIAETRRVDGRLQVDASLASQVAMTAGAEVLGERGLSTYITGPTFEPLPIRRQIAGFFAEARIEPSSSVSLSAGVRVEHIERDALEGDGGTRPAFDADTEVSTNPRLAVSWLIGQSEGVWSFTRLRASAATGIRPPDAFEIVFTDNPNLAPERSRSFEVGLEQALAGTRVTLEAAWFHNQYDDLIVAVGTSYQDASRYLTDNIANARARGLELSAALRPLGWMQVRAGYTFLDATVLAVDGESGQAPSPFVPGEALIRRPRHQGWAEALASHGRGSAFLRTGARGSVLDIDPSFGAFGGKVAAPGFTVVDVGASCDVWRGVSAFGRVTNLFDREYEEAFGFPSLGRAWVGGFRIAASR